VGGLLTALLLTSAAYSYAQFARDGGILRGEQGDLAELPPGEWPDRHLAGCHLHYTSVRSENNGSGWRTDYPWGQRNLLLRLSQLTRTRVSWRSPGVAHVWLVGLTDPALFDCPYVMASDVGTIGLSPEEADALRRYLQKGGFLWVDDFWGGAAWDQWSREIAQVMPEDMIEDVPLSDPIFHAMVDVKRIPQVPGIGFWRRVGGQTTSERGPESEVPDFRAIRDRSGRIMVVMTHDTDLSNSWERETEDSEYFYRFSVDGYAVGINVLLYAMTH
jgi:hypothetical protein